MENNIAGFKRSFEDRLPAVITTLAVWLLLAFMPSRIRFFPYWVFCGSAIAVIIPMIVAGIASNKKRWLRVERIVTFCFCLICGASTVMMLATLVRVILDHSSVFSGLQLLSSSIAVWNNNVLVFTLLYWQIDRGGPQGRLYGTDAKPDLHFPAQDLSGEVQSDWKPTFIDYLFLGFSTSTAFSMTEAVPLTHRAKLLMMLQSAISLATIVVVGARAINILGS